MLLSPTASSLLGLVAIATTTRGEESSDIAAALLDAAIECNQGYGPLKFVILEEEAVNAAIEDDIRQDLAKLGFQVERVTLSKADINTARQSGDFHFSITETWGTPYDPHSFASGWIDGAGGEGVYEAMVNFEKPSSREDLLEMVKDVLQQEDPEILRTKWEAIHNYYHKQAIMMPFYGKRIPTVLNTRLAGYEAGYQQFDYPIHKLRPNSGSTTVTIAPGARTGLFQTVGTLNAHVYGPNEFFSNNWIYEGLVSYGADGVILPSLAIDWNVKSNDIGGDTYTFQLRPNVTFHDGEPWNCESAKINFDHVLAGSLKEDKHAWYGVGLYTEDWSCNDDLEFQIRTNFKHGPYLQELTLIRPIRMISPKAFVSSDSSTNATNPLTHNSCHLDWGTVDTNFSEAVNCVGIQSIAGTGPFVFVEKETADLIDQRVIFKANEDYWSGAPLVKQLEIVHYASSSDVKGALLNQELDLMWGSGVLSDADLFEIQDREDAQHLSVFHSAPLQNVILLLNSGMPPLDDINVRKTVIHAINKGRIVHDELKGLQQVVDNIFPLEAPYCDVDLTPKWDYDFEKAVLLSCGRTPKSESSTSEGDNDNKGLALGLGIGLGLLVVFVAIVAFSLHQKSKKLQEELDGISRKEEAVSA
jgi:ABC-type transport system substrate-binding protein